MNQERNPETNPKTNRNVQQQESLQESPERSLGRKAYGSIPHIPGSRIGPGEHHVNEGQEDICLRKVRDRYDRVIVTEKLDGANVAVANMDGAILPLGRAGYPAESSPREHIRMFGEWVQDNEKRFRQFLEPGESLHGEWLALAHGTIYALFHEPLVIFDLKDEKGQRKGWDEIFQRCTEAEFTTPRLISDGPPVSMEQLLARIRWSGHGALPPDEVEGAVWRIEHQGKHDFMAKWVRPDKDDGKYLPEISGEPAIWNWTPEQEKNGTKDTNSLVLMDIGKAVAQHRPDMDLGHELSKIPDFRKSPIRALGALVQEPHRLNSPGETFRVGAVLKGLGEFLMEESLREAQNRGIKQDQGVTIPKDPRDIGKAELPFNPRVSAVRPDVNLK